MGAKCFAFSFIEIDGREYGLCFKHARSICNKKVGEWKRTPYGWLPIRDQVYELKNNDITLLGPGGIAGRV